MVKNNKNHSNSSDGNRREEVLDEEPTCEMAVRSQNRYAGLTVSSFPSSVRFFFACWARSVKSCGLFRWSRAMLASEYSSN